MLGITRNQYGAETRQLLENLEVVTELELVLGLR